MKRRPPRVLCSFLYKVCDSERDTTKKISFAQLVRDHLHQVRLGVGIIFMYNMSIWTVVWGAGDKGWVPVEAGTGVVDQGDVGLPPSSPAWHGDHFYV